MAVLILLRPVCRLHSVNSLASSPGAGQPRSQLAVYSIHYRAYANWRDIKGERLLYFLERQPFEITKLENQGVAVPMASADRSFQRAFDIFHRETRYRSRQQRAVNAADRAFEHSSLAGVLNQLVEGET